MKITDLARLTMAYQATPTLSIAALPSDEFADMDCCAQIEIAVSFSDPDALGYGISAAAVCDKQDLIDSLRKAIQILELLPNASTLQEIAEAMGEDLQNLLG